MSYCSRSCRSVDVQLRRSFPPAALHRKIWQVRHRRTRQHRCKYYINPYVLDACLDEVCQAHRDAAYLHGFLIELAVVLGVVAYEWLASPSQVQPSSRAFVDPKTGASGSLESSNGCAPERRQQLQDELAFRVESYTPLPVAPDAEGERLRIPVGPICNRKLQTYIFKKTLQRPSELVQVTLPRPLGLIIEQDAAQNRVVVRDVVKKSQAGQRLELAKFDRARRRDAALPGDIVRGCTTTSVVVPRKSLAIGVQPLKRDIVVYGAPERHVVVFGADGQRWPKVVGALRQGSEEDGPVTLILERPIDDAA